MPEPKKKPKKRGPKEERLIIEGDPEEALDKLLKPTQEHFERKLGLELGAAWREGDTPLPGLYKRIGKRRPRKLTIAGETDWFIVDGIAEPGRRVPAEITYRRAKEPDGD